MKRKALITLNKRYGALIPVQRVRETTSTGLPYTAYECKCDCGNTCIKTSSYIINSPFPSCGCVKVGRKSDVGINPGDRFGELTVLSLFKREYGGDYMSTFAHCECDCGNTCDVLASNLKSGNTTTCGHNRGKCLDMGSELLHDASLIDGTSIVRLQRKTLNKNSTTGHIGVSQLKSGKYRAHIMFRRKQYHLGVYLDIQDAIKAREKAEEEIHGNFLKWYAETYPDKWEKLKK